MPKPKFVLSKKHEYLIDAITQLPKLSDDNFFGGNSDLEINYRYWISNIFNVEV